MRRICTRTNLHGNQTPYRASGVGPVKRTWFPARQAFSEGSTTSDYGTSSDSDDGFAARAPMDEGVWAELTLAASPRRPSAPVGRGRIVAVHHRSSASRRIRCADRCLH